jgi:Lon protease-like protein
MPSGPAHPVPVLPLTDAVLFPHAVLPLRITDFRQRTLVRDALRAERTVALALSRSRMEPGEDTNPEVFPLACLARIEAVEWLPDDCYDLKLLGLARVRLERRVREYPYAKARVLVVPHEPYTEDDPLVQIERQASIRVLERLLGAAAAAAGIAPPPAPGPEKSYEAVVSMMCMCLEAGVGEKLSLLELDSVIERGKRARERIERRLRAGPRAEPGEPRAN